MTAIQKETSVFVYGSGNRFSFSVSGELKGYASNTASVKRGNIVFIYNNSGKLIGSR